MKLQILSDLHIETHEGTYEVKKSCNILCLLGDIGLASQKKYRNFIKSQAQLFDHVFVIAGNHEYYDVKIELGDQIIEETCSKVDNLHFLNNSSFIIDNVRFIGTTLWSRIPIKHYTEIMNRIADYERIRKHKISDTNRMHDKAVEFIENEIKLAKELNQKVVILTHHAPIFKSAAEHYLSKPTQHAYATPLEHLFENEEHVKMWGFGHTHWCNDVTIGKGNTRVVSNCFGYEGEDTNGFNPEFTVEI